MIDKYSTENNTVEFAINMHSYHLYQIKVHT